MGVSFALLGLAAVLPARGLLGLNIRRNSIEAVSAGDQLTIELQIENQTTQPKTLLQVQDLLPSAYRVSTGRSRSLPRFVGMEASGKTDLAERDEELLWQEAEIF